MMVVMLIVAVVLAATAPMITRRISRERSDKIFDQLGTDPQNAVEYVKGRNQRIYMDGRTNGYVGIVETGKEIPQGSVIFGNNTAVDSSGVTPADFVGIGFGTRNGANSIALGNNSASSNDGVALGYYSNSYPYSVAVGRGSSARSEAVAIGYQATAAGSSGSTGKSVAIGYNAAALKKAAVAIGYNAKATSSHSNSSVLIGANTSVTSGYSMALGYGASVKTGVDYGNAAAIGYNASVTGNRSTAIGYNATAPYADTIVLGNESTTVYIPGNLVVRGNTGLGLNSGARVKLRMGPDDRGDYASLESDSSRRVRFSDHNRVGGDAAVGFENAFVYSDARLKNVGNEFTGGLDELSKLKFYNYTYKKDKDKTPQVGIMAQDLQKVFPDAVEADKDGWLTIRWDDMFYAAINAIKELNTKVIAIGEKVQTIAQDVTNLKAKVEKQQATIDEQQTEIKELSARVEKLEKRK